MTRFRNRYLVFAYMTALLAAFVLGCGADDEEAETLVVCGNHTCGDLTMVTIDTNGVGGYQYLEPAISPDGTRVAFTADWEAIPSIDPEELDNPILNRQVLVMPLPVDPWDESMAFRDPVESVEDLGAVLVLLDGFESLDTISDDDAERMTKNSPSWIDDNTLLFQTRFLQRDRLVRVDISDPGQAVVTPVFYEPEDLVQSGGGQFIYHHDPAVSPDGRWCAFTRFRCDDFPNQEGTNCEGEALWVLDLSTTSDPAAALAVRLTGEAAFMEDPTWSPDGRTICFSATTDLVGNSGGFVAELFTVAFDPVEAASGSVALDRDLRRVTTTMVSAGDPLVGLTNQSPVFTADGRDIIFVSSRRAPGSTQRGRNLWRVPADGRLEPEMIFFSRFDDFDPTLDWSTGTLLMTSRMGFPTEMLNGLAQKYYHFYTVVYNDTSASPLTEVEIQRRVTDLVEELGRFADKMSHLFLFRGF